MDDTSLEDYLETNLFYELRDNDTLESGLATAIVEELGKDATDYKEESLNGVLVSYIMEQLSNRISREIANMNYIINTPEKFWAQVSDQSANRQKEAMIPASIGHMLDLIEEDLQWYIEYIRIECFDPGLLSLALDDIGVTGITADIFDR